VISDISEDKEGKKMQEASKGNKGKKKKAIQPGELTSVRSHCFDYH
jgi:hypothetical protein